MFTNISGSYTGPKLNAMSVEMNGLKSHVQVPPDSSLMVRVEAPALEDPELEVEPDGLELLLHAAASSPAAASAAVRAVHLEVWGLM